MFSSDRSEVTSYFNCTMKVQESASIFSQNSDIVSTEQNSTFYTTITSVHALMFSQHSEEVNDHINRSVYLSSFEILSQSE